MFESIQLSPPDPILGLLDLILSDKRKNTINLGIGIYQDEQGYAPVLSSVKQAELFLLNHETTKNYLNIEGIAKFNKSTQELLFGKNNQIIDKNRIKTVQTPGGSAALRIAADFLKNNTQAKRAWISDPGWINHKNIFRSAGFEILKYPYYNYNTNTLNFDELLNSLSYAKANDIVVLHGCCHNPTGTDPNIEEWKELSELSLKNNWIPLFDFAYQGFSESLNNDLIALHTFCNTHKELIVCSSYSKNFNLYNERVGSCTLIAPNEKIANKAFSQLKYIIRSNYSSPPSHGASIVTTILNDKTLRSIWEEELKNMRTHINSIRNLFAETLNDINQNVNFQFVKKQKGMFSFIGLNKFQVQKLRDKSGIYMPHSGRINICGLTKNNINYICKKLLSVI